jgi:hypothetical protein
LGDFHIQPPKSRESEDLKTPTRGDQESTQISKDSSLVSGKPGESGLNPGYSAPPEPSEQIFKELDFEWICKVAYVINVSLSSINTLD